MEADVSLHEVFDISKNFLFLPLFSVVSKSTFRFNLQQHVFF